MKPYHVYVLKTNFFDLTLQVACIFFVTSTFVRYFWKFLFNHLRKY